MKILIRIDVIFIFIFIINNIFLSGCKKNNETILNLERAEQIMETFPDSALDIIASIDYNIIKKESEKAKYGLLLTQAMIKNGYAYDSDSLITLSVNYYEKHGNDSNYMKSLFYRGVVFYFKDIFNLSIKDANKAFDLSIEQNNDLWRARTAELMADNYSKNYLWKPERQYLEETIEYYSRSNKLRNVRFSYCDLAANYFNDGNIKRGIEIADSIYGLACRENDDPSLIDYSGRILRMFYVNNGEYEKASILFDDLSKFEERYIDLSVYWVDRSKIELSKNNYEKALQFLIRADSLAQDEKDKAFVNINKAEIYYALDDIGEANKFILKALSNVNAYSKEIFQQSVALAQKEFYEDKSINTQKRLDYLTKDVIIWSIISFIIILLFLFLGLLIVKNKNLQLKDKLREIMLLTSDIRGLRSVLSESQQLNKEFEKNIEEKKIEVKSLSHRIQEDQERIDNLNKEFQNVLNNNLIEKEKIDILFKEKYRLLNRLCNDFFDDTTEDDKNKILKKAFKNELKFLREKKSIEALTIYLNESDCNIIENLKNECDNLKEDDINLYIFLISGCSTRLICSIFEMKQKTFYTRKRRLIEKIKNCEAINKENFISKIK